MAAGIAGTGLRKRLVYWPNLHGISLDCLALDGDWTREMSFLMQGE